MPVVEKTSGGRVYIRPLEREFELGDEADVSDEDAAYLCDERGDFERVRAGATDVEFREVDDADDESVDEAEDPDEDDGEDEVADEEDEAEDPNEDEGADEESDVEICGAEMSDGDICERPADECPYHGDDEEE